MKSLELLYPNKRLMCSPTVVLVQPMFEPSDLHVDAMFPDLQW